MNRIVSEYCTKSADAIAQATTVEQKAAAAELQKNCGDALRNSTDPSSKLDPNAIMGSAMKWLTIGGLVVLGVYFAPLVATKATQAFQAFKKQRSTA
jgi:hypothetical protein